MIFLHKTFSDKELDQILGPTLDEDLFADILPNEPLEAFDREESKSFILSTNTDLVVKTQHISRWISQKLNKEDVIFFNELFLSLMAQVEHPISSEVKAEKIEPQILANAIVTGLLAKNYRDSLVFNLKFYIKAVKDPLLKRNLQIILGHIETNQG